MPRLVVLMTLLMSFASHADCISEVMKEPVCLKRGEAKVFCAPYGNALEGALTAVRCVTQNKPTLERAGATDPAFLQAMLRRLCLFPEVRSSDPADQESLCR